MTKADLVEQVAAMIGPRVTKRDCGLVVDAFLDAVKDALARGNGIEPRCFCTFKVWHRKARKARNPMTGEAVEASVPRCAGFQPFGGTSGAAWTGAGARRGVRARRPPFCGRPALQMRPPSSVRSEPCRAAGRLRLAANLHP